MKDLVIVYKSKYGSTEKYAKELAKILNADIFDESNIKITDLKNYKTLIYGGGVYASGIAGITLITKNFEILKDMNLIIFTVTLSNPLETDFSNLIKHNFKNIDSSKLHLFHLRGGIDYKTLNFIDKLLMKMLKMKIEKIPEDKLTEENKLFIKSYGNAIDFIDFTSLSPIINHYKSLTNDN